MTNPLSIDPVPILSTSFLELVDKRTVGKAVFFTEEYQISTPPPLPEEQPDPLVGEVRLRECPKKDSSFPIFISGYSEVSSTPSTGQFSVDYVNGVLSFPTAAIGSNVTISYYGLGSIVMAADVNNITAQLTPFFNKLNGGDDLGLLRRTTVLATSGQTVFSADFPVSPTETMVYSQGLLMTPGGLADYIVGGPGVSGSSISDTSHFISLSGGTLTINLNNDGPRTITLGTDATGADIAADIQIQMRALTAITGGNQAAYNGFTASYDAGTGLYTLTSGTVGTSSTVVVTGASDAALLELGLAEGGIETAGTAGAANGYALLSNTAITNVGTSIINGDVDTDSATAPTPGGWTVYGTINTNNSTAATAFATASASFTAKQSLALAAAPGNQIPSVLDGQTLTATGPVNTYTFASGAALLASSGAAGVTFSGSATDVFIIYTASSLGVGAGGAATVNLAGVGPVQASNIYWVVGSAATLQDAGTIFNGNILAQTVNLSTGGTYNGQIASLAAALTLAGVGQTVNGPPSATAGTSVSETASIPVTTTSGGVLLISVDGVTFQPIILAANVTGAAIAADIQAKVSALFPSNPSYSAFTASYDTGTGLYTLTSGTVGLTSSVVLLKAGVDNGGIGTEGSSGTSVSGATPATSVAGGTLTFNLNGDGLKTINLAASGDTTGSLTAADIQFKVRATFANSLINQAAYNNFTADYNIINPGKYTFTSGTVGTGSSVVVSAGTDRVALKLGTGYGAEVVGTPGTFVPNVGMAGTSVSGLSPSTTATALTFNVNINGDGAQPITVDDGGIHTGAHVALVMQAAIRALTARTPSNQAAINATTVGYITVYTITSGISGPDSSVVITGLGASTLKLGLANGGRETKEAGTSSGDTLTINLNGDGFRIITLGSNSTGETIAADVQAKVRALIAISPIYQNAYNNFTAVFSKSTGAYTLTSGMTTISNSVMVADTSLVTGLALGLTYGGAELIGVPGSNQITFNTPRYAGEIINFINIGI